MVTKKKQRHDREQDVLLGLIELYLKVRSPIGSNTLHDHGFDYLSSATIRNYFVKLENQGFLRQQHSSGGRIPTTHAYRFYATHYFHSGKVEEKELALLKEYFLKDDGGEIALYLQKAAHLLSDLTQGAVFFSSPRFDQDFITSIQLVSIDSSRYLAVITTNFGLVRTEILHSPMKLSQFNLRRLEDYFRFRLSGRDEPLLDSVEEKIGLEFYNEILLRYLVHYAHFHKEEMYKTGFSKLLLSGEFQDASFLATAFSLFEDHIAMTKVINHCMEVKGLKCWIGDDLDVPEASSLCSSVTTIPYFIHGKAVGAVGVLTPIPSFYPKLFATMRAFSELLSEALTRNLYKYKITYRKPSFHHLPLEKNYVVHRGKGALPYLEDQTFHQPLGDIHE